MSKRAEEKRAADQASAGRWTEQDARRVLEELDKSGETVAGFALRRGLVPQRLFWWRKRLERVATCESKPTFIPVTVRAAAAWREAERVAVVVTAGDGVRVEVREVDAATAVWVASLVLQLGERRS
jgi:hypothetical protein